MARHDSIPLPSGLAPAVLDRLALELHELRQELLAAETELAAEIGAVHPDNLRSARNLVHYLALRRHDIRALQLRLARAGLSSLGRSESHVLFNLDRVLAMLALARGMTLPDITDAPVAFRQGQRMLATNARRLLGRHPPHRAVRIMVTLPSEAAEDRNLVEDLVAAGMDCARINCARDDAAAWSGMAEHVRAASRAQRRECRILVDLAGPKPRTGLIGGGAKRLVLTIGDRFELVNQQTGFPARANARPRIACTTPELFAAVQTGESIWFDDGILGGVIEACARDALVIRVTNAKPDGSKLRPERGINLPDTSLILPALTAKDLDDLSEVVSWADVIELSFVQRREDVIALHDALRGHGGDRLGIVLKIETRHGFADLPQLLLASLQWQSSGVMIARGDLAVETGFERMAEIQEEVLWIAEAAHLPTIWATKVLDTLAKEGALTRAEMTDAAMSARAEAVMLNKGPFIIDAILTLDDILGRMKEHQSKKRSLLRALRVSRSLWE